jgi:hypothetical protein
MKEELEKFIQQIKMLGISKGNEFLMTPEIAISFITKLAENDVKVAGCDLWKYTRVGDHVGIVSLLGADFGFDDYDERSASQLAEKLIRTLKTGLPKDAELVSLLIMDSNVNDKLNSSDDL